MKVMQIFFFLALLNVSFILLNVTGIYYNENPNPEFTDNEDYGWATWSGQSISILIVATFVTSISVGILLSRYGVNPYMTAAYTVFVGVFVVLYGMFVNVLNQIGNQMGEAKIIMDTFLVILTIVMALLMMYTAIQMAVGGGKGFE